MGLPRCSPRLTQTRSGRYVAVAGAPCSSARKFAHAQQDCIISWVCSPNKRLVETIMIVRYESDGTIVMITQNDHAQLSGLFATHWGNSQFAKPEPYMPMVRAAMFHDRGWIRY